MRIVSLLPSATEIICALGLEDDLVGRSHECDFPPGVERLPVCTNPKVGGGGTRAIHASVAAILQHDISVYSVEGDRLRELRPTHIVTQVQCEVCAVSLRDVEEAIAGWSGIDPPRIVALNAQSLEDVFADIRRTASAVERHAAGERTVASRRARIEAVAALTGARQPKPRVATVEWMEPLMAAGNWMPELVERAGGINLLGRVGTHSPWLSWEELAASDPDLIVVAPCGFRIADSQRDWHLLTANPAWRALRAVRDGRAFVADGNQYFNRPGPRLAESVEILAEIFHGLPFGQEGIGWQRCSD
jgi:iron complex transport system substrate-binding protein